MVREIWIPIDAIIAMLKDYASTTGDIPEDTIPLSLQVNPAEQGMFAVLAESNEWTTDAPLRINFDIKRVYSAA